jgi:hypothetical protein
MAISDDALNEYKEIYKKEYGKDLSDAEARDQADRLLQVYKILWDGYVTDLKRQQRLKKEPDGFTLDGTYTCNICHCNVGAGENWYSRWGITCLTCLRALKDGVVPGFVCKHRKSWYAMWELKSDFGIHPQTARKMIRIGELKARIILTVSGQPHEYVLLKKENPHLIDPDPYSPARKSYDRNRKKLSDARIREAKRKDREEREKERAEWKKKLQRNA